MITEQIIQGCLKNDRKSQRMMYEVCYNVMSKVCKRYIDNDDEVNECMNIAFMKILKNLSALKNEKTFFGWVKQISINTAIDYFRSKKKYTEMNTLSIDREYSHVKQTYQQTDFTESNIDSKEIFKLIQQLPDLTRQVLNLFAIDGYTHKEVGTMLGLSEEASRWHLHKARKIMTEKLNLLNMVSK